LDKITKAGADLPRWGVVATMDEPAQLVAAWAAHHLAIGASEVWIFLDRPNPGAEALLAGIEGVYLHRSGDDGWARAWKQKRPARHQGRQKYNATRALAETGCDWLCHCDADEFIAPFEGRDLARDLGHVGPGKVWVKLEVEERSFVSGLPGMDAAGTIFQGDFRRPWIGQPEAMAAFYGPRAPFVDRGLGGHVAGKSITRAGLGLVIGVHYPLSHWDSSKNDQPYRPANAARLRHFDGMTPLHYLLKMIRRATTEYKGQPVPYGAPRKAQFTRVAEIADDPQALLEQWWAVQGLSPYEASELGTAALLVRGDDIIVQHALARFPGLDLTPAGFDAALIGHEAALIALARERFGFDPAALAMRG
jgi:hypothetical protein